MNLRENMMVNIAIESINATLVTVNNVHVAQFCNIGKYMQAPIIMCVAFVANRHQFRRTIGSLR